MTGPSLDLQLELFLKKLGGNDNKATIIFAPATLFFIDGILTWCEPFRELGRKLSQ